MGRPPHASRRHHAIRVGIALLAVAGATACASARRSAGGPAPATDGALAPRVATQPANGRHLLLRVGERRLYLMDEDPHTPDESFPIAVGRKGKETPIGRFHVEEMVVDPDFLVIDKLDRTRVARRIPPGPQNPLGARWIGFAHGEGWTVGIHGTPRPELLGQAVSGGCIRMRNADVIRIFESVQLGTPVIVTP
jgi:hypothetical protein